MHSSAAVIPAVLAACERFGGDGRAEIEAKFRGNCEHGGWPKERAQRFLDAVPKLFDSPLDLAPLRG